MNKIVYGYFKPRGLGESVRYLLHYKNVDFEDKRYVIGPAPDFDKSGWLSDKFNLGLDFPNLPYLIDGDVKLTQSCAILRYLARKYGLNGENEAETIRIDLAEQQLVDVRESFYQLCYTKRDEFEKRKEEYLRTMPQKLHEISKFLGDRKFVIGNRVTYVDFILYEVLDFNRILDSSLLDSHENLNAYMSRFEALPSIERYMKSGDYGKLPITGPRATFGN